jgi:hypothetical protein
MQTNYPQPVTDYINDLSRDLERVGFFSDYDMEPELGSKCFRKFATEVSMEQWLADGDPGITEAQFTTVLRETVADYQLTRLVNLGLVDTVIDENGEEVYFLTQGGKEVANQISEI